MTKTPAFLCTLASALLVAGGSLAGNAETTAVTPKPASAAISARPQQMFVGLSVADLAKSEAWYRDVFGMQQVFATQFDGGAVSVLECEWLMIELLHQKAARPMQERLPDTPNYLVHGVFKLGVFVPDLDAVLAQLDARGTKPASQIYDDKNSKTRNVFVTDPEGNRWQLFQRTRGDATTLR
jgi:catechol 2,3-dioxygenase-like lactoylglutathione lyase family enzyme